MKNVVTKTEQLGPFLITLTVPRRGRPPKDRARHRKPHVISAEGKAAIAAAAKKRWAKYRQEKAHG